MARNPGAIRKATSYSERLRIGIAVIHGEPKDTESEIDETDGRTSPPPQFSQTPAVPQYKKTAMFDLDDLPAFPAKEKPPISIVGDVGGRIAIMIDDVIDDVDSFISAAELLRDHGAYKIYVLATHGFFSPDAPRLLEDSPIDEIIVTNTGMSLNRFGSVII